MALRGLDHYNIKTVKPEETVAFYCDVLGCEDGMHRRPAIPVPGTWLLVGDHPAIHIVYVDEDQAGSTGAIDHVAFEGSGYLEMCDRLTELGIDYRTTEAPEFDILQIFLKDPNQIRVEINIRGEAEAVAAARDEASSAN